MGFLGRWSVRKGCECAGYRYRMEEREDACAVRGGNAGVD